MRGDFESAVLRRQLSIVAWDIREDSKKKKRERENLDQKYHLQRKEAIDL